MAVTLEGRICLRVACCTKYCFVALRFLVEERPLGSHLVNSSVSHRGGQGSNPSPVHIKFVVDNIVLGQGLFRILRVFPISITLLVPRTHLFICYQRNVILATDTAIKYYI
jgi:hypothetical protein